MQARAAVQGFAESLADLAPQTRKTYARSARAFLRATGLAPEAVTPDDVRRHLADLSAGGMTDGSVAVRLCALRAYFDWLLREGRVRVSPVEEVPGPRVLWATGERLAPEVVAALQDRRHYTGPLRWRNRAMVLLLLRAGLRIDELLGLAWADVCTETGRVWVWAAGRGVRRLVQLDEDAFEAVLEHWIRAEDVASVFPGRRPDAPLTSKAVQAVVRRVGASVGLDRLQSTDLRRTYPRLRPPADGSRPSVGAPAVQQLAQVPPASSPVTPGPPPTR